MEKKRQKQSVGRIEKIEIRYLGLPEDVTLVMNKGISTPYNCAQHLSEGHCKRSALALLDGNLIWDMHRPLEDSCTLQLLNFTIAEPHAVNRVFWRTCSFMLGSALNNAFKDEAGLELHSFPSPNVKSGSFVHDVVLSVKGWQPNEKEMRAFSTEMVKLALRDVKIERLDVNLELALEIFNDNRFKKEHLPNIASNNNGKITLYRVGNHIDISKGPMVGSTGFLGKCTISSAHQIGDDGENRGIYRFQGVALPTGIKLNHFAFDILVKRSRKLNPARLPTEPYEDSSLNRLLA
ncbi:39S ribosomal protein L39, mitochondrial [Condylostylus longicornis]|uniref:39S ribosomal protein L39, mitochondrial n=1 Tax=Condylostylus longicornis TaxID=2530218 RepID=UPI00244D9FFD|nr:39S ribosomal protein L39, mitochondrial [Condylostylus longicornis]